MVVEPSRLELKLLGPVEALVDGAPLAVDTKKAVALLAYLAVGEKMRSRDHLADLLWPEADPERARATLRRTLSALRSGLGDRWIEADRSAVVFVRDSGVRVDVEDLLAAVEDTHGHEPGDGCPRCIESLAGPAGAIRGEFMEGFALRGCPEFDDWLIAEAEHVRRRVSSLHERLATAYASQGRYGEAIESARRWLETDPLHERAHRTNMLLHAWSGDRSGAIDAYRSCVAVLDRELGVEPLEETTELYEAIAEEDLPRAPATPRRLEVAELPKVVGYPLVGRNEPLGRLLSAVESHHGLVILEGELGVGKTRLIEALADQLERSAVTLVIGAAHRSESAVAYGPIQSMLSAALEAPGTRARIEALPSAVRREVARLLPSLGETTPVDPSDGAARTRFLDALSQAIADLGESVTMVVDNIHWLDGATLELIGYIAHRLERLGVVMILTRRPEDTPVDHPASVLVEDLSSDADIIRLERLDRDSVADLVRASGVTGLDVDSVFERTRGLAFFVIEYLDSARNGLTEIPHAVRRLVLGRIAEVDAAARQVLTAASVIGASADIEAIRDVSGRSEDEIVSGLDELIRRSMLRERGDGVVEFVHEQVREVAYEDTGLNRRRLLHRRAAEHFSSRPGAVADHRSMAMAAGHHWAAGNDAAAAELSARAGDLAAEVFAFEDAIGHLENALALGHPDRASVLSRLGGLRTLTGDYGAALAAYETARATVEAEDVSVIANSIGEVYRRLRRWDVAAVSFEEALTTADDPALRSRVAANLAFVEHRRGNAQAARSLAALALESANAAADPDAEALAHNLAGLLSEDESDRASHYSRGLALATLPAVRAAVLNNSALSLASAGNMSSAIVRAREALEQAVLSRDRHRIAALHDTLADMLHASGDEDASMAELKEAVAIFAEIGVEPGSYEPEVWLLKEW
jgi:DNA-binding SARP family transcriptional activator